MILPKSYTCVTLSDFGIVDCDSEQECGSEEVLEPINEVSYEIFVSFHCCPFSVEWKILSQ